MTETVQPYLETMTSLLHLPPRSRGASTHCRWWQVGCSAYFLTTALVLNLTQPPSSTRLTCPSESNKPVCNNRQAFASPYSCLDLSIRVYISIHLLGSKLG